MIVVMAVLAAIVVGSTIGDLELARNNQRANDVSAIARSLEQYYRTNAVSTGASYPNATVSPSSLASIVDDSDLVTAPQQTTNSIVIATTSGAQNPTVDQYLYQPLNVDGSLCSASPCARYRLFYQLEVSGSIVVVNSLRQQ